MVPYSLKSGGNQTPISVFKFQVRSLDSNLALWCGCLPHQSPERPPRFWVPPVGGPHTHCAFTPFSGHLRGHLVLKRSVSPSTGHHRQIRGDQIQCHPNRDPFESASAVNAKIIVWEYAHHHDGKHSNKFIRNMFLQNLWSRCPFESPIPPGN